jgi:tRNA1Val (adenine37-N6)-methyltransferase
MSGLVRAPRRPPGWVAPGPPSRLLAGDWPGPDEDLCWLTGDWRIFQRTDGHRFSLDDVVTAWFAGKLGAAGAGRLLDLGCGIGSVLLMMAWQFPERHLLGVEAQAVSAALARRSIALNGAQAQVLDADFREADFAGERFALVTGTPPYFPRGTGVESDHVQRGPCRFEHRGGVEAYCQVAARVLAEGAAFVGCAPARDAERVEAAARSAGLVLVRYREVVGREGKPPLFAVFAMRREGELMRESPLVVRDRHSRRTEEFIALRADMGMPP